VAPARSRSRSRTVGARDVGALGGDVVSIGDDAGYLSDLRRADTARTRAYNAGQSAGRAQGKGRRVGGRFTGEESFDDPDLGGLYDAGGTAGFSAARRAARRDTVSAGADRVRPAVDDGAGFLLGMLAFALVFAYLEGGTAGVRRWIAAKFVNAGGAAPASRATGAAGTALGPAWFGGVGDGARTAAGFVFPVAGGGTFADDWGQARSGGRAHRGTDIFAPRGSPVVAATDGVVRAGFDNRLGGTVVRVAGVDGNRYYYAHLEPGSVAVQAGQYVRAGQRVGAVGNSGNASGGATHLHFSINEGTPRATNPYSQLRSAR